MSRLTVCAPPVAAFAVAVALAGCSSSAGSSDAWRGAPAAPGRPVIGKLQTRDRSITLMSSHDGLRVTVEDRDGATLARDVDVEGLRAVDPLAYEMCRSSLASRGTYLDARHAPAPPSARETLGREHP
jgi:hypothetical protein